MAIDLSVHTNVIETFFAMKLLKLILKLRTMHCYWSWKGHKICNCVVYIFHRKLSFVLFLRLAVYKSNFKL